MCRVSVITVGPHAPSLYAAPHLIGQITVAAPDARAQAILRIVRQLQRFFHRFEGGHRQHRAKNLLLEHPHIVLTKQNRRFEVVAVFQFTFQQLAPPACEHVSALFFTDINVVEDGFQLPVRNLRAHLRHAVERVTATNAFDTADGAFHKAFVDRFLH